MLKIIAYFVSVYFTLILLTNGQTMPMTLPPMETLPPDTLNSTSLVTAYDQSCIDSDNSTDGDGIVYLGAVALNNDNECQVICSKQVLQQFNIFFGGTVRIRAVIIGNIFMASMPDNSTCAQTGTCSGGICSVNSLNSTGMPDNSTMTETTTMMTNSTEMMTNSTTNSTNVSPVF